jgi:MFS family permease
MHSHMPSCTFQWKHAGAVLGAVSPIAIVQSNYSPLFLVYACMMGLSIASINSIRDCDIDHELASGLKKDSNTNTTKPILQQEETADATPLYDFFTQKNVAMFLGMVVLWHFANAPMLPSVGFKIQQAYEEDPDNAEKMHIFGHTLPLDGKNGISLATIVAHIVMIPVAKFSGILAALEKFGSRRTLTVATVMIVLRGVAFALTSDPWSLLGISFLDGLSAGAFGVLAILMVGDLAVGSGHANLLQGAMAASIGMGSSISNGIFGAVTEASGVNTTFWWLAAMGCIAVALLVVFIEDLHDYEATNNAENISFWGGAPRSTVLSQRKGTTNPLFETVLSEDPTSPRTLYTEPHGQQYSEAYADVQIDI